MAGSSIEIFIKGNVPSLKNSKVWTGKRLISSKSVRKYVDTYFKEYQLLKLQTNSILKEKLKPYKISFKFIRGSRHRFDYINAAQLPLDLMVKVGMLEDDNADNVIPIFEPYEYNKENPGVIVKIL